MDEDLTLEERKLRWRILETARRERARGRVVDFTNREMCIKWSWNEREEGWDVGGKT